jgi:hypothetical protein
MHLYSWAVGLGMTAFRGDKATPFRLNSVHDTEIDKAITPRIMRIELSAFLYLDRQAAVCYTN